MADKSNQTSLSPAVKPKLWSNGSSMPTGKPNTAPHLTTRCTTSSVTNRPSSDYALVTADYAPTCTA